MSSIGKVEPFKIGFIDEGFFAEGAAFDKYVGNPVRLRFEEALNSGEVDRPIELVVAHAHGLPSGTTKAVRDGWMSLREQGCLAVIGPGVTDNCMALFPLWEKFHVPTINYPGTTRTRGEYGFHYQMGSLYDDGRVMGRALLASGISEVAVIRDRTPIGQEFFEYFADYCEKSGVDITCDLMCSPIATDFTDQVRRAKASGAKGLVYLGFGQVLADLSSCLKVARWEPPRFTVSAGMHWYTSTPSQRELMAGWIYIDQVDEENEVLMAMVTELKKRYNQDAFSPVEGTMYDCAALAVLGLHYATVHTPEGVKEGLERINLVPSALGAKGTVMGFGPYEHSALKGQDYLLLRQMLPDRTVRYLP